MVKKKVVKKVISKLSHSSKRNAVPSTKVQSKVQIGKHDVRDLTIHFMPYSEIAKEDALGRIKKIMGVVLQNKIIILQGKLKPEEEAKLIEHTMALVGNLPGFQGIEIAVLSNDNGNRGLFEKVRHGVARILVGEQDAVTIIGPASVIKEIQRNPKKAELLLKRR